MFIGTEIYVNEDLCKEIIQLRRKGLWDEVRRLCDDGKYVVLRYVKIVSREFHNIGH